MNDWLPELEIVPGHFFKRMAVLLPRMTARLKELRALEPESPESDQENTVIRVKRPPAATKSSSPSKISPPPKAGPALDDLIRNDPGVSPIVARYVWC